MANLLKEKLVISVMGVNPALDHHHHHHQAPQLSHPGALSRPNVSVSLLSDIESKFEPFSSFADRDDEEVVSFYSQLAKAHLPLHSDLCKEIIQRNLLFDRDGDRDGNGDLRQQLRQLEGRHCLAVCNFMNGAVDVVPFQRLEKEYLDLMNAFEDNIDNDVRERLAGKLTSLVENIAYIAIVQVCCLSSHPIASTPTSPSPSPSPSIAITLSPPPPQSPLLLFVSRRRDLGMLQ